MGTIHREVIDGIRYDLAIAEDDLPVRGNALASGDDAEDTQAENDILDRLNNGDVWAWASVRVTASLTVEGETFEGTDYLGGCSYADTAEFIQPGGYYDDMKGAAKESLMEALASAVKRGEIAATTLTAVREN